MDTTSWITAVVVIVTLLAIGISIAVQLRAYGLLELPANKQGWTDAVRALCDELGLKYESVPTARDRARGTIGNVDVRIEYDVPDIAMVLVVEIYPSNVPELLTIRRPRAPLHRNVLMGKLQALGIADFDAEVEISGASASLLASLQNDATLRTLVRDAVVGVGAVLADRHLRVEKPRFPTEIEALRAIVVPMVELGAWLASPDEPRTGSALGTRAAARLRVLRDLRGEPRSERLVEFFNSLGPAIGSGQSFPRPSENKFEWQGTLKNRPLRISVTSSGSVAISMKQKHRFGDLWFTYDPDVKASDRPPAWDEEPSDGVFVGPSTLAQGFGSSNAVVTRRIARLPPPLAERVGTQLAHDRVRYFRIESDEVSATFWPDIEAMHDPEGQLVRTVELAAACADAAAAYVPNPSDPDPEEDDDDD